MLDGINQCWQFIWSARAMNATQSCCWERETKICHSAKNSTSNGKFTKYVTKLELSFWKDEGRNIHSAGLSLHFTCADTVILLWSKPSQVYHISPLPTPLWCAFARSKPQTSKIITHCANSKAGTQFNHKLNLDVKFFSRNSPSKEIHHWL